MKRRKNFLKIPEIILRKAKSFDGPFVVGCVQQLSEVAIRRGDFERLGVKWPSDGVEILETILPHPKLGRYSKYNVQGRVVVHRDLPKILRTFTVETPNFGDWSRGSHEVSRTIPVWQKTFIPPRLIEIGLDRIDTEAPEGSVVVRIRVNKVIDPKQMDWEDDLLFCINLLQENVGTIDLFPADASLQDYLQSLYERVGWEIFPPGNRDATINAVISRIRRPTEEIIRTLKDRYDFLEKLGPKKFLHGEGGFEKYFGALFSEKLVAFENLQYGNALYILKENWKELSKLSRTELLKGSSYDFERIKHSAGWQSKAQKALGIGA